MDRKLHPLFEGRLRDFPSSKELPEGAKTIALKDTLGFRVRFVSEIEYAQGSGESQRLHLLLPEDWENPERAFPLIVFVQGSA